MCVYFAPTKIIKKSNMQRNYKKEYSFLTKNHARLFKYDIKKFFHFTSDRAFYDVVNGVTKLTSLQESYVRQQLFYYHDLQRRIGKVYCDIDINIC